MRKSHWLWLCAAMAVTFLVLLAWRWGGHRRAQSALLPDGRKVTIEKLTYGTEHKFIGGNVLARIAGPIVPPKWETKLGVRKIVIQTGSPSLVIWTVLEVPKSALPYVVPKASLQEGDTEVQVAATRGSAGMTRNGFVIGWQFENFPRRAKTLHFVLSNWTNNAYKPVVAFDLPNPVRREFPIWRVSSSPVCKSKGGLEFEALNFCRGSYPNRGWWAAFDQPLVRTGYLALFRVKEQGRALRNWQVEEATILDAAGNRAASRFGRSFMVGDYLVLGLPQPDMPLWPSEKTWKLIPQFTRRESFASNELCLLRGIRVPISEFATQMLIHAEANGVPIIGLDLKPINEASLDLSLQANLRIGVVIQPREDRVINLIDVVDDRGRRLRHGRAIFPQDGLHFAIELQGSTSLAFASSLDLTFAIQEPVTAEFVLGLAEPEKGQPRNGQHRRDSRIKP